MQSSAISGSGLLWIVDIHLENREIGDVLFSSGELADTLSQIVDRLRNRTLGNDTCSVYESPNKTRASIIGGLLQVE
jgi:hypothetical protein